VKAILLIDHGSTRAEANHMLECMASLVQHMAGDGVIVRFAHMELAEPSIDAGFAACVEAGATAVTVFPYMLSPGKHSTSDIPRLVAAAAARHPGVSATVTSAFGVHEKLAEVVLDRARVAVERSAPLTCWDPAGCPGACGEACRGPVPGRAAVDVASRRAEAIRGA
jgi:sirohydrochlorin ferrochelatase